MKWELCDTKTDNDKVLQVRKLAESEIELLEKEQEITQERKDAIIAIYQANYQYSSLLMQTQEKGLNQATECILNFLKQYNYFVEKSMQIRSAFTSEIIIKTNKLYYELEQKVNEDSYHFINTKIPELMNTLNSLDKENPVYQTYKDSVEKMIQNTFDNQFKQLNHLDTQQQKMFDLNHEYLNNAFVNIENKVCERLSFFNFSNKINICNKDIL